MKTFVVIAALALVCTATRAENPAKRFPAIVKDITDGEPKLKRDPVFAACRRYAETTYSTALGIYPPGDYRPDMIAVRRLSDCLTAGQ